MALTKATYSMIDGPVVNVKDFGAVGNGVTDDTTAIKNALTAAAGGTLVFEINKTYLSTDELLIPEYTTINLNESKVLFNITGNKRCFEPLNHVTIKNGHIELAGSAYTGAGDSGAPIAVGRFAVGRNNITVDNVRISSNKDDGSGIIIMSDSNNISLTNIYFEPSAFVGRAIEVHWGGNDTTGTTHPHNINIKNIYINNYSKASGVGLAGIFLSAVYNVSIDNVQIIDSPTFVGITIFGGDLGFEYATPVALQEQGMVNVRVTNFNAIKVQVFAFFQFISPFIANIIPAQVTLSNCYGTGEDATDPTNRGIYFNSCQNINIETTTLSGFYNGIVFQDKVDEVTIDNCIIKNSREAGLFYTNIGVTPDGNKLKITNNLFENNNAGSFATQADILGFGIKDSTISNNVFNSSFVDNNIRLDNTSSNIIVSENTSVNMDPTAGPVFVFGNLADSLIVSGFYDNRVINVPANGIRGGQESLPFTVAAGGIGAQYQPRFISAPQAPTSGAWRVGDIVYSSTPTAGNFIGFVCTTAGTPGTWKTFGPISA
jgi:hypothetical protein